MNIFDIFVSIAVGPIVPPRLDRLDVLQIVLDVLDVLDVFYWQVDLVSEGWRVREAYSFGMPRPGDAAFARTFDGMCQSQVWPDIRFGVLSVSKKIRQHRPDQGKHSKTMEPNEDLIFNGTLNFNI